MDVIRISTATAAAAEPKREQIVFDDDDDDDDEIEFFCIQKNIHSLFGGIGEQKTCTPTRLNSELAYWAQLGNYDEVIVTRYVNGKFLSVTEHQIDEQSIQKIRQQLQQPSQEPDNNNSNSNKDALEPQQKRSRRTKRVPNRKI